MSEQRTRLGKRLIEIRQAAIDKGMKLMSADELKMQNPEPVVSWQTAYKDSTYSWDTEKDARDDFLHDECARALLKVTHEPGKASVEIVEERK